jgi:hypothetical protein
MGSISIVLALIALQTMNLDPDMVDLLLLIMPALSLFYYVYCAYCYLYLSLKLLLKLEQLRESSVPGPGLGSMPDISNNMRSTHNRKVIMLA